MPPELLAQTLIDEPVANVGKDGTYNTKGYHATTTQRGAQAVIRPRKNATPWRQTRERADARQRSTCDPAKGWGAGSGRSGAAITEEAWRRPRCIASSAWESG